MSKQDRFNVVKNEIVTASDGNNFDFKKDSLHFTANKQKGCVYVNEIVNGIDGKYLAFSEIEEDWQDSFDEFIWDYLA